MEGMLRNPRTSPALRDARHVLRQIFMDAWNDFGAANVCNEYPDERVVFDANGARF